MLETKNKNMPILGRTGESVSRRLFGRPGLQEGGKNILGILNPTNLSAKTRWVDRAKQGAETAGGYFKSSLGKTAQAYEVDPSTIDKMNPGSSNLFPIPKDKPNDLDAPARSSGASSNDQKIINSIGRGWDDSGEVLDDTSKSLKSSKNYISNLAKVRDKYISALEGYKTKTDEAIAGNKTLIERNQKTDLEDLAGMMRKDMDNTNVMLGVKGASGGSASKQASRALAQKAGKERSKTLTGYGDEFSKQNQESKKALEEYTTKKAQSYEWEKTERARALEEFDAQQKALERLARKKGGWEEEDIKNLSSKNLDSFMGSINAIQQQAASFRQRLADKASEYGLSADELENAAVEVTPPAELDTPVFDETIDFTNGEPTEDWFNPDPNSKRVIKGYDALGNPIYEDEIVPAPVVKPLELIPSAA